MKDIRFILKNKQYFFRQIKNRIITKLFYKFFFYKSVVLNDITILLTYKCNLRCIMCPQWGIYGLAKDFLDVKQKLTIDVLKNFIDEVSELKPSVITLSGGEPFLYDDWYEVAKYIKQKNITTCVITNGTLIDKFINEIITTVDILHISIDGIQDVHNNIRGQTGIFEKSAENIKALQDKNKNTQIIIAYTFSYNNFSDLENIINYFEEKNIEIEKFIFQHLLFLSNNISEKHKELFLKKFNIKSNFWDGFLFSPNKFDIDKLNKEIEEIKRKYKQVIFKPDFKKLELYRYYEDKNYLPQSYKRCIAPYLSLTLLPNGDIWICPSYSIGNIKDNKFINLWNNKSAKYFRKILLKEKLFPACRACCYLYEY